MQEPPLLPRKKSKVWIWLLILLVILPAAAVGTGFAIFHFIATPRFTRTMDNQFGDQYLKTAVALIELHKLRYGKYPDSLRDLKFTGQWDQMTLTSVKYVPSPNRDAYYIEVERGWMGKPDLTMPAEFWKGTGYSASLKPASNKPKE